MYIKKYLKSYKAAPVWFIDDYNCHSF